MRYRLDHARIALLGTLLLVGVQFVVFSRISDCPRYLSDDSPLLLRNLIRPDFRGITSSSRKTSVAEDYDDTGSACILICDDNHFLIEWIAYHYHVMNLRTLIITSDPNSRTSPHHVLDRWRDRMDIEYWNESHFLDPDDITSSARKSRLQMHRLRQRSFNVECLKEMKRKNRGWTIVTDTDEFVMLNPRMRNEKKKIYKPNVPSIREPGSVISFLNNLTIPDESVQAYTPCVPIARIQFSSRESSEAQVQSLVPENFNGSDFLTLRWRKFGTEKRYFGTIKGDPCGVRRRAGPVKAVIDLSRLKSQDLEHHDIEGNPHTPLESICSDYDAFAREREVALVAHHYLGTKAQWTYRVTDSRGGGYRLARFKDMNDLIGNYETDDLRPWLQGFVDSVGSKEALALLKDVGQLEPIPKAPVPVTLALDTENKSSLEDYKVGDLVLADWRAHGEWEWAHITAVFDGGFYNVIFLDDCQEDLGVGRERLKRNGTSDSTNLDYEGIMKTAVKDAVIGFLSETSDD